MAGSNYLIVPYPFVTVDFTHTQLELNFQSITRYINALPPATGYKSLTGPGETVTPGALTQAGNFAVHGGLTVTDSTSQTINLTTNSYMEINTAKGLQISDSGAVGSAGFEVTTSGTHGGIRLENASTDPTIGGITLNNTAGTVGTNITDATGTGIIVSTTAVGNGLSLSDALGDGIIIAANNPAGYSGIQLLTPVGSYGLFVAAPSNGFTAVTADVLANLPTPPAFPPSWGFTQDGHIYFYAAPTGPWTLKV